MKLINKQKDGTVVHWCAGCNTSHALFVDKQDPDSGLQWVWNGDYNKPTFTPANYVAEGPVCHYSISNGKIGYFSDTTHALAGQSLALAALPD